MGYFIFIILQSNSFYIKILNAPTLTQVKKANNENNDFEKIASVLVDMSNSEMDEAFLNSLPMSEIAKLNKIVENFIKFDEKTKSGHSFK